MTKISEMSTDIFSRAVKEALAAPNDEKKEPSGLINKALQAKVPIEDINAIISDVYTQAGAFSLARGVNKVRSAIENKIRAATATSLSGILVGSHDLVGKQAPCRYTLIRADKKHYEISSFDNQAPYQGGKIDIPVPAAVVIKAEYDQDYDSWHLVSIEKYQPLSTEDLLKHIPSTIIPISAITQDFAYHKVQDKDGERVFSARPVVIAGYLSRMSPEAVFRFGEDSEGNRTSTLDRLLPVMCGRESKPDETLPCVQFLLNSKTRGINSVRCHISQQRKGTPTILVNDFITSCEEAVKRFKDPESQAGNVHEWMHDTPVIVIGSVNRYARSTGQDKAAQNWVDIGVTAIIDAESIDIDAGGAQKKITPPEQKATAVPPTHTTNSKPIAGPIESTRPPADQPPAGKKRSPGKKSAVQDSPSDPSPANAAAAAGSDMPASPDGNTIESEVASIADEIFPPGGTPAAADSVPAAAPAAAPSVPGTLPPKLLDVAKKISAYCNVLDITPKDISVSEVKIKMLDVVTINGAVIPDSLIQQVLDHLKSGGKV